MTYKKLLLILPLMFINDASAFDDRMSCKVKEHYSDNVFEIKDIFYCAHKNFSNFADYIKETRQKEIIIKLDSNGGNIQVGDEVVEMIEDLKDDGVNVIVEVGAGKKCYSYCNQLAMSGSVKNIHPKSKWMFHETQVIYEENEVVSEEELRIHARNKKKLDDVMYEKYIEFDKDLYDYLVDSGIKEGKDVFISGSKLCNASKKFCS